jgi:carbonic anhydrase/acetyltransferase-like protein (isoleucine patch superfamily)
MLVIFKEFEPSVHESAFVAPTAVLVGQVKVAQSASIWFNCVVRADINSITIGANSNIQDGCMLHVTNKHPLVVGDRVTAGHGAILHGCKVEDDCLIAMGAIVLDGAVIGSGSIVAAGAVVAPGSEIPPGSLVMGIPGKVIRQVTEGDRAKIERGWKNYVGYSQTYKQINFTAEN